MHRSSLTTGLILIATFAVTRWHAEAAEPIPLDAIAPTAGPATQVTDPVRYPWDHRMLRCFRGGESAMGPMCAKAVPDWPSVHRGMQNLYQVFDKRDFAVIAMAEQDVALSTERMPDGEYRATLWTHSLGGYLGNSSDRQAFAESWHNASGANGTGCLTLAMASFADAMEARGGGLARTVTDEAWKLFHAKLDETGTLLDACPAKVKATLPWHEVKLQTTYLRHDDVARRQAQLQTAIAAWPDAADIYGVAMNYALPIWGGSFEAMEEIAQLALSNSKSTMKTAVYAQLYANALYRSQTHTFDETKADWSLMKQSFRDRESYGVPANWLLTRYVGLACAVKDREEAKRLFLVIEQFQQKDNIGFDTRNLGDPCVRFAFGL